MIGKIVIKSIFNAVILFFAMLLFVFNILALFLPCTAANIFDSVGVKQLTVSFTCQCYKRSNNINDLSLLIDRAIKYNDTNVVITYVSILKSFEYYNDFADFKDNQFLNNYSDYKNYIDGNYLIALYSQKEFDKCIELCTNHLKKGYLDNNPIRFLVRLVSASNNNFERLNNLLIEKYNNLDISTKEKINLCVDLYSIYSSIKDTQNTDYWQNEYQNIKNI